MVLVTHLTISSERLQTTLRQHREAAGYSQEGLARELGVSRQTVANIERGVSEPRVLLAIAIGALLGLAVTELFKEASNL